LPSFTSTSWRLVSGTTPSSNSRLRISTMSSMGALPTGQTCTQAEQVVQAHTASTEMAYSHRGGEGAPLLNSRRCRFR